MVARSKYQSGEIFMLIRAAMVYPESAYLQDGDFLGLEQAID
jgi:hypothetical protein